MARPIELWRAGCVLRDSSRFAGWLAGRVMALEDLQPEAPVIAPERQGVRWWLDILLVTAAVLVPLPPQLRGPQGEKA